jgi:hypothetical protein
MCLGENTAEKPVTRAILSEKYQRRVILDGDFSAGDEFGVGMIFLGLIRFWDSVNPADVREGYGGDSEFRSTLNQLMRMRSASEERVIRSAEKLGVAHDVFSVKNSV